MATGRGRGSSCRTLAGDTYSPHLTVSEAAVVARAGGVPHWGGQRCSRRHGCGLAVGAGRSVLQVCSSSSATAVRTREAGSRCEIRSARRCVRRRGQGAATREVVAGGVEEEMVVFGERDRPNARLMPSVRLPVLHLLFVSNRHPENLLVRVPVISSRVAALLFSPATILSLPFSHSGVSRTRSRYGSRRCANPSHRLRTRHQPVVPAQSFPRYPARTMSSTTL